MEAAGGAGALVGSLEARACITSVAWLSGDRIAAGASDGRVTIWKVAGRERSAARTGRDLAPIACLDAHSAAVTAVAAPSSRSLLSGGADGTVARWNLSRVSKHGSFRESLRARLRDVSS